MKKRFLEAIAALPPDFDTAKEILDEGLDINANEFYEGDLLTEALRYVSDVCADENSARCQSCYDEYCIYCDRTRKPDFIPIIDFFAENGWNSIKYGLSTISALVHTTHDVNMFYAAKRLLELRLSDEEKQYDNALSSIGSEESFQRCCEENHEEENIYSAMYAMVEAKQKCRDFSGIHTYHRAVGRKIDNILYFSPDKDFKKTRSGVEFGGDFGLLLDDELLVVASDISVLFDNSLIGEKPCISCPDIFGIDVIGSTITDISFGHKTVIKSNTQYGQAIIILKLDCGREIRFTHNFGEQEKGYTARFITSQITGESYTIIHNLFALSSTLDFSIDKIESYIVNAKPTVDEITLAAIRLVEHFADEASSFKGKNGREPRENELVSSKWVPVFRLFLKYGLDPTRTYTEDGSQSNLVWSLLHCDNRYSYYKVFRLLFDNGLSTDDFIFDESLFEMIDGDVVTDATLLEIEGDDREIYEREFRLWLLMIGYGATPAHFIVRDWFDTGMFKDCEAFSYRKEVTDDDWFLHVYITKTREEVAVL
ncbi:MAG: hypothetical protein IKC34_00235 [Clostridia bacterium]|nr:hypothetical protein [Clostridia bacterium]